MGKGLHSAGSESIYYLLYGPGSPDSHAQHPSKYDDRGPAVRVPVFGISGSLLHVRVHERQRSWAGLMGLMRLWSATPRLLVRSLSIPAGTPTLPPTSGCGVLPTTAPVLTTAGAAVSYPSNIVQWPTTWPAVAATTAKLYCKQPANQPTTPTINFVGSLVPVEDYSVCGTPGACNYINPLSTQTDAFPHGDSAPAYSNDRRNRLRFIFLGFFHTRCRPRRT